MQLAVNSGALKQQVDLRPATQQMDKSRPLSFPLGGNIFAVATVTSHQRNMMKRKASGAGLSDKGRHNERKWQGDYFLPLE